MVWNNSRAVGAQDAARPSTPNCTRWIALPYQQARVGQLECGQRKTGETQFLLERNTTARLFECEARDVSRFEQRLHGVSARFEYGDDGRQPEGEAHRAQHGTAEQIFRLLGRRSTLLPPSFSRYAGILVPVVIC